MAAGSVEALRVGAAEPWPDAAFVYVLTNTSQKKYILISTIQFSEFDIYVINMHSVPNCYKNNHAKFAIDSPTLTCLN